jgi:hypothetical protein
MLSISTYSEISSTGDITVLASRNADQAAQDEATTSDSGLGVSIDRSVNDATGRGVTVYERKEGQPVTVALTTSYNNWQVMRSRYGHTIEYQST